jgi:hypothetical protein
MLSIILIVSAIIGILWFAYREGNKELNNASDIPAPATRQRNKGYHKPAKAYTKKAHEYAGEFKPKNRTSPANPWEDHRPSRQVIRRRAFQAAWKQYRWPIALTPRKERRASAWMRAKVAARDVRRSA